MNFFLKLINGNSPESSRRFVVLVILANFIAMVWYLLLHATDIHNTAQVDVCIQAMVVVILSGWTSISVDNFNAKKKTLQSTTESTSTTVIP